MGNKNNSLRLLCRSFIIVFIFPPAFVVAAASLSPLFVINFRLCVAAANLGEKLK